MTITETTLTYTFFREGYKIRCTPYVNILEPYLSIKYTGRLQR